MFFSLCHTNSKYVEYLVEISALLNHQITWEYVGHSANPPQIHKSETTFYCDFRVLENTSSYFYIPYNYGWAKNLTAN